MDRTSEPSFEYVLFSLFTESHLLCTVIEHFICPHVCYEYVCVCVLLMGIGPELRQTNKHKQATHTHTHYPIVFANNNFNHHTTTTQSVTTASICFAIRNENPLSQAQTNQLPPHPLFTLFLHRKTALRHKPTFGRSLMWKFVLWTMLAQPPLFDDSHIDPISAHPQTSRLPRFQLSALYTFHIYGCISGFKRTHMRHTASMDSIRKILLYLSVVGGFEGGGAANTHSGHCVSTWYHCHCCCCCCVSVRQTTSIYGCVCVCIAIV